MNWKISINGRLLAGLAAVCLGGSSLVTAQPSEPPAIGTNLDGISLTIRCTNSELKAGDEIPIEFLITNCGTDDYNYSNRTYDRSGRMGEYELTARTESGENVPDPRAGYKNGWFGGGLYSPKVLHPGESASRIIPLNRWALVKEPGRYEITATFVGESQPGKPAQPVSSKPITITVLPRSEKEMGDYINELRKRMTVLPKPPPFNLGGDRPNPEFDALVMRLMYTCDPRAVPALLDAMRQSANGSFWGGEGLLFYIPHTAETEKAILEAAAGPGLGPNGEFLLRQYGFSNEEVKPLILRLLAPGSEGTWATGASLAERYNDDEFAPRLIAIAARPGNNGRANAIAALVYNRTDEGVNTVKRLLDDNDESIWTPTADALLNAYNPVGHSNWPGRPLRPDDFSTKDIRPLIEHMLASDKQNPDVLTGVSLLQQFGNDGFTAQLIAIAEDPNNIARGGAITALAFNRSDEGVEALKELLNSNDEKCRAMVERSLRYAYTTRGVARGRPLRPDDFDAKYQMPK